MNILLLGGGGREHALAWALSRDSGGGLLVAAPGNGGVDGLAERRAVDIEDPGAVLALAQEIGADLVVIGPEAPLAAGVSDALIAAGVPCFGPSRAAAMLEISKAFTKEICAACGAPTAASARFGAAAPALAHLSQAGAPIVVKADGLAAGKGVVVAETEAEAESAIRAIFDDAVGADAAGAVSALLEEKLTGDELSYFVLTDGETVRPFGSAQDHKRAFDGDQGPNTGGMGAYAPAPLLTPALEERILGEIIHPVLAEMRRRGTPYRGVLYAGLMVDDGQPKLIEFNARFGDPEAQVLMLRLASDLAPALAACAAPRPAGAAALSDVEIAWRNEAAMTVVMAAQGYPGSYAKGEAIRGLDEAASAPGVEIFHAGTRREGDAVLSAGGRVLNVTARRPKLREARDAAYAALAQIDWPGGFHRSDIGWRALDDEG
ncbi:MAG: phosphoribosylamine--glycine ligase [Pseudomonadota bacterium]